MKFSLTASVLRKIFHKGLSVFMLGSMLFSVGATNASWLGDMFNIEYEDEVKTAEEILCFTDIQKGTLEAEAACYLKERGVIGGFPDGEFKGERLVNRAEAAKFLLLGSKKQVSELRNNGGFPDVLEGEWYVRYVINAAKYGLINGYPDKSFRPAQPVNTAEFLKMATKAFGLEEGLDYRYADVSENDWFSRYAGVAEKYKLFPERTTRAIDPAKNLTRKEVAIAIYRILKPIHNITLPLGSEEANCVVRAGGQIIKKIYTKNQKVCDEIVNYKNKDVDGDRGYTNNCSKYRPYVEMKKYAIEFSFKNNVFYRSTCPQVNPLQLENSCSVEVNGKVVRKGKVQDIISCKRILDKGGREGNCRAYRLGKNVTKDQKWRLSFLFNGRSFYNEACTRNITPPTPSEKHILQVSPILNRSMDRESLPVPFHGVSFLRIGIKNTENIPVYIKSIKFQARGTDKASNYSGYKARLFPNVVITSNGEPTVSVGVSSNGHIDGREKVGRPPVSERDFSIEMSGSVDKKGMVTLKGNNGFYISENGYREFTLVIDAKDNTAPGKLSFSLIGITAASTPISMEMAKERDVVVLNGKRALSARNSLQGKTEKLVPLFSNTNKCHAVVSIKDCVAKGMCDTNGDSRLDRKDIIPIQNYILGISEECGYGGESCYCDLNQDKTIDIQDMNILIGFYGNSVVNECHVILSLNECSKGICDANGDGIINTKDVTHLREYIEGRQERCGGTSNCGCDIDGSGSVSVLDALLLSQYISTDEDEKEDDEIDLGITPRQGPPNKYSIQ